ncbi:MAG: endonuclease V [Desulfuromonadales bacterium]|nr:endonuclease V [Desulfuromonadales bacterium]
MILAVDVDYRDTIASISGVYFSRWEDAQAKQVFHSVLDVIEDYKPGQFYLREMPCIMHLLNEHSLTPEVIVIDGYVYLGDYTIPGLGIHLYNELEHKIPIIGVAKRRFKNTTAESEVYRGNSKRPLYVTSVGIAPEKAKNNVLSMHGKYRVPTLLKDVDRECRKS